MVPVRIAPWPIIQPLAQRIYRKDDALLYKSLKGMSGVIITVDNIPNEITSKGLDEERITSYIELRLRNSGIKILSQKEYVADSSAGNLYISIDVLNSDKLYAISIEIKLRQMVRTLTLSPQVVFANSWERGFILFYGEEKLFKVRQIIDDLMVQFCNDFLKANPKS